MKALSVKQPWAQLIFNKHKTIETRTYKTRYRGDLLICASKVIDKSAYNYLSKYMTRHNRSFTLFTAPTGMALCVVNLYNARPMFESDQWRACCDIYQNAHSWFLDDLRPVIPFPVKGQLGLFDVDDSLIKYLQA